jgi:hypothetical protein
VELNRLSHILNLRVGNVPWNVLAPLSKALFTVPDFEDAAVTMVVS